MVIPPFTPLAVDRSASTVACVLRRHILDGTGLWRQVVVKTGREISPAFPRTPLAPREETISRSEISTGEKAGQGPDRPLLASPMRLEIEVAGKTHVAAGESLEFTEEAADRVRGEGRWIAGPIRGRTLFEFDYDGMAKLSLRLPAAGVKVDAMQLVIPMRTDETWLMHAVTDLLRFHYAGRIPDGHGRLWDYSGKLREVRYTETGRPDADGRVWDSRHVSRFQLPPPLVPYIWLGGPERGLCWFAENDRDWSLDPDRPMLEIRRLHGQTLLIVRLIDRPVVLCASGRCASA